MNHPPTKPPVLHRILDNTEVVMEANMILFLFDDGEMALGTPAWIAGTNIPVTLTGKAYHSAIWCTRGYWNACHNGEVTRVPQLKHDITSPNFVGGYNEDCYDLLSSFLTDDEIAIFAATQRRWENTNDESTVVHGNYRDWRLLLGGRFEGAIAFIKACS